MIKLPAEATDFSFTKSPSQLKGPPCLLFNEHRGIFLQKKALKARNWPLTSMSAEVKNEWSYTYRAPYTFIKCTDKL